MTITEVLELAVGVIVLTGRANPNDISAKTLVLMERDRLMPPTRKARKSKPSPCVSASTANETDGDSDSSGDDATE